MGEKRAMAPRVRTLKTVERDLRRARRAERKLRADWNRVTMDIAANGGLIAGQGPDGRRVSPLLRQQRELDKARKIQAAELKALNAELVALEAQAKEGADEYSL